MEKTSPEIAELKHRIEENVQRKMKTSSDFDFLSGVIWDRTHEIVSASTLKRIWGYVDGPVSARRSTLDVLSQFLGFKNLDAFLEHISQDNGSDRVTKQHIKTDELQVGDSVFVSWKPNRRCMFRYLGDYRFIVEQAENSKLKVGKLRSVHPRRATLPERPCSRRQSARGLCGGQQGWALRIG